MLETGLLFFTFLPSWLVWQGVSRHFIILGFHLQVESIVKKAPRRRTSNHPLRSPIGFRSHSKKITLIERSPRILLSRSLAGTLLHPPSSRRRTKTNA